MPIERGNTTNLLFAYAFQGLDEASQRRVSAAGLRQPPAAVGEASAGERAPAIGGSQQRNVTGDTLTFDIAFKSRSLSASTARGGGGALASPQTLDTTAAASSSLASSSPVSPAGALLLQSNFTSSSDYNTQGINSTASAAPDLHGDIAMDYLSSTLDYADSSTSRDWNLSWADLRGGVGWDDVTGDYNLTSLLAGDVESPADEINFTQAIVAGMVLGVMIFMTISGNLLVLLAVFVNSHLRSTTNYFIVNLACADLLLGTCVLPFSASLEIINYWAFGPIFCDIWAAVDVLCCTASIMSLCVISIDRYIGVTRPLQHSSIMSEKRALYIIILVWLLSIAISVAPLFGWKEPPPEDPTICEVTKQLGYVLFSVAGSFYIPLIIILVVYFRVYREAMNQSRFLTTGVKTSKTDEASEVTLRIHTGGGGGGSAYKSSNSNINQHQPGAQNRATPGAPYQSSSSSEHSESSHKKHASKLTLAGKVAKFKREKKAAKTLGIVVGVFISCWLPFFFVLPLEALSSVHIPDWLFKVIFWLGYCNSMMNPIIYAMSSREFKRAFIRILKCRWRRRPRQFLPENHFVLNFRSETEMTNMKKTKSRFAALREYAKRKRRRRRKPQNRRDLGGGGGVTGIFAQNPNPRRRLERESPIASLKLLQAQQRQLTVDTVLLSDDESGVQGGVSDNDEDLSDSSNEMSPMKNCDASGRKPNMAHKQHGKLEEIDERTGLMPLHSGKTLVPPKGSSRWGLKGPKPNGKASSLKKFIVPDIVIDDTSVTVANRGGEKRARPTRLDNSEQSTSCINSHTGTAKQDNIMWL